MRSVWRWWMGPLLGLWVLAGCARAEPTLTAGATPGATDLPVTSTVPQSFLSFTDDRGHTVQLAKVPQRIVAIGFEVTEVLVALGASGRIVGVDSGSKLPAGSDAVARLGEPYPPGDAIPPTVGIDVDAVVGLRPDLVVADSKMWVRGSAGRHSYPACPPPELDKEGIPAVCIRPVAGVNRTLHQILRGPLHCAVRHRPGAAEVARPDSAGYPRGGAPFGAGETLEKLGPVWRQAL